MREIDTHPSFLGAFSSEEQAKSFAKHSAIKSNDLGYGTVHAILKQTTSKSSFKVSLRPIWTVEDDGVLKAVK